MANHGIHRIRKMKKLESQWDSSIACGKPVPPLSYFPCVPCILPPAISASLRLWFSSQNSGLSQNGGFCLQKVAAGLAGTGFCLQKVGAGPAGTGFRMQKVGAGLAGSGFRMQKVGAGLAGSGFCMGEEPPGSVCVDAKTRRGFPPPRFTMKPCGFIRTT
jgi:hypothetical protein